MRTRIYFAQAILCVSFATSTQVAAQDSQPAESAPTSTLMLRPIPEPPDVTLSDEFLVAPVSREVDAQSPVDLEVRAMTRALDDLHEMKSAMRVVSSVVWFLTSALMLSVGAITTALITPAPLEPFIFAAGSIAWGLEAVFHTSVEEDVRNAWRALSVAERHVEYPRYERHLLAMAEAERRHITLTSVAGFLMTGLATVAIGATIATDGPLGVIPLGLGVIGYGLIVGMVSFIDGYATRIYSAFDQGLYNDPEFSISDLTEEE